MSPTTTEKHQAQFPDLEYAKIPTAAQHPHFSWAPFNPGLTTLSKGHVRAPGNRPFSDDTILDRDVAIPMRDNIKVYADIFRPVNSDSVKVPALLPWSPYGKSGSGPQQYLKMGPFRCGVAQEKTSGYEKFEAPDPAEWCGRGYAIVNADARGAGMSEGSIAFWGQQDAEDIYDAIEWLSKQPWCNGSVAMIGNSWLAAAQNNFGSRLSHPALKALAPMEGFADPYREVQARGGMVNNPEFTQKLIMLGMAGPNSAENMPKMLATHPLFDEYWASKQMHVENIDVPLYIVASYSTILHTYGSLNTFRSAKSTKKWLRIHRYQEWYDLYRPEINDELQRYFDRYCKEIENGWEHDMPPIRLSLLGFDNSPAKTVEERPEQEYPLARQELHTYYLDAKSKNLLSELPSSITETSHAGHDLEASSDFILHFPAATEIVGYSKARLWMSCAERDDLDVVVQIRKISRSGEPLEHLNYPCPVPSEEVPNTNIAKTLGPQGMLRASHAVSREPGTSSNEVFYKHDRREPIQPGTIVCLDIPLWPMGMVFAEGEGIMLRVSGHDMAYPEVAFIKPTAPIDENVGTHVIHTGGKYDSHLILPVIPPK